MIRIINYFAIRVIKYSSCFFKWNIMFLYVFLVFLLIPDNLHIYNIMILSWGGDKSIGKSLFFSPVKLPSGRLRHTPYSFVSNVNKLRKKSTKQTIFFRFNHAFFKFAPYIGYEIINWIFEPSEWLPILQNYGWEGRRRPAFGLPERGSETYRPWTARFGNNHGKQNALRRRYRRQRQYSGYQG